LKGIILDLNDISDSREVMESKESPKIRWFIYILCTFVVAAILAMCFFTIDQYTNITGELKTNESASSILATNSCKLKQICVSEGQEVKEGDVLFVLDSDYAAKQKDIIQSKLASSKADLSNTQLLMQSIKDDKNLFKNDASDSKYFYRFEQYKNGKLLSAKEVDNTILNNSLSQEEKQNKITSINNSIAEKNSRISEYNSLISCIRTDSEFSGKDSVVVSEYNDYKTNYEKAKLICDQSRNSYDNIAQKLSAQVDSSVSSVQVEFKKQTADNLYQTAKDYKNSYLSDIRSQIVLLENQLINDGSNEQLQTALSEYKDLKAAIEQDSTFTSSNADLNFEYEQFTSAYNSMINDYSTAITEYTSLYNEYLSNAGSEVSSYDVSTAESSYQSAAMDLATIKNTYISKIEITINSIENELASLEESKKSLELSLKGAMNTDNYEKLSSDKLKNEAIVTISSEIDALNDNIASLESQLVELDSNINNSEIRASVDGTVTLINDVNCGDMVQAGNSLCSIIPKSTGFKVMLYIPESDISKISVGQKTDYAFDALPYSEYGKLSGEITSISADAVSNDSGIKYYVAQASLSDTSLTNKKGETHELKNGMIVRAKSINGTKKAISWLLEKLNFVE